jgi:hypothetical protein
MKPATNAVLLSALVFPGLGQLHQKRPVMGCLFIVLTVAGLVFLGGPVLALAHELAQDIVAGRKAMDIGVIALEVDRRGLAGKGTGPALLLIGTWLASAVDAWLAGRRITK